MACSGGWDWAPFSGTVQGDAQTFTKGIWKDVYLTQVDSVAITHVVPHAFYLGPFPTSRLSEHDHGGFRLDVRTYVTSPNARQGVLEVSAAFGTKRMDITIPKGEAILNTTLPVSASDIELWWPAGYGSQPMYIVNVTLTMGTVHPIIVSRRVVSRSGIDSAGQLTFCKDLCIGDRKRYQPRLCC
eukprot:m.7477 g.7477  ORF g.7477 m.7477 type:complete len:185 (+) comp8844_c0_seq1:485-1039(+)